jgi:hypothetical protein
MRRIAFNIAAVLATAAFFCLPAGCTERERQGLSAIPQSSPTSWELQPYGQVRN